MTSWGITKVMMSWSQDPSSWDYECLYTVSYQPIQHFWIILVQNKVVDQETVPSPEPAVWRIIILSVFQVKCTKVPKQHTKDILLYQCFALLLKFAQAEILFLCLPQTNVKPQCSFSYRHRYPFTLSLSAYYPFTGIGYVDSTGSVKWFDLKVET